MSKLSKKKVIGITGSMGSGKSEISRYLRKKYPVLAQNNPMFSKRSAERVNEKQNRHMF